jgi:two-component system, sensor histidine kinase
MSSVPTADTATEQPGEKHGLLTVSGNAFARAFDLAHAMIRETDGRIRFWSSSLEHLYGWTHEEAIGRISHHLLRTEFPQPLEEIEAELLRTGRWEGELKHQTRDGRTVVVASHWALDRNDAGQPTWVIEVNNDITALKAAEEERNRFHAALSDAHQRLELAIEAGQIGTWEFDLRTGRIRHSARRCALMGLPPCPIEEHYEDFLARVHPEDREMVARMLSASLEAGGEFHGTFRFVWPDGSIHWVESRAAPPRDRSVDGARLMGASIDITDRELREADLRRAKEAAERATRSKSRVLAAVGHDLKQPLHIVSMALSMLERDITAVDQKRLLGRADRAVDQLAAALDTLLEVARLEAGVVAPRIETFPVERVLNQIEDQFELLATHKGLSFEVAHSTALVRSDPRMLATILHNLVGNAIKYTERGRIEVACRQRDGFLSIEVRDTGIGIPPDKLDLVFEEFQRLETSSGKGGVGLGLAIVRHTANALGHPLRVQSSVGAGSVFSVDVPSN